MHKTLALLVVSNGKHLPFRIDPHFITKIPGKFPLYEKAIRDNEWDIAPSVLAYKLGVFQFDQPDHSLQQLKRVVAKIFGDPSQPFDDQAKTLAVIQALVKSRIIRYLKVDESTPDSTPVAYTDKALRQAKQARRLAQDQMGLTPAMKAAPRPQGTVKPIQPTCLDPERELQTKEAELKNLEWQLRELDKEIAGYQAAQESLPELQRRCHAAEAAFNRLSDHARKKPETPQKAAKAAAHAELKAARQTGSKLKTAQERRSGLEQRIVTCKAHCNTMRAIKEKAA